jgi:excisionase family DNA binding protein
MDGDEERQILSTYQAGRILSVSSQTIRRWIKSGQLRGYTLNQEYKLLRQDVMAYIKKKLLPADSNPVHDKGNLPEKYKKKKGVKS